MLCMIRVKNGLQVGGKGMIIMNSDFLEPDEYAFGYYKVQRVEWEHGEWHETGYWLNAVVTNHRMVMYPRESTKSRKTLQPLDIRKAWNVCLKGRDGIMI